MNEFLEKALLEQLFEMTPINGWVMKRQSGTVHRSGISKNTVKLIELVDSKGDWLVVKYMNLNHQTCAEVHVSSVGSKVCLVMGKNSNLNTAVLGLFDIFGASK